MMHVLLIALLAFVSFARETADGLRKENQRLQRAHSALRSALKSLQTEKEVRVGASYDPWYSGQCQQPELDRGCFYDELYTARCMCPRAESRVGSQAQGKKIESAVGGADGTGQWNSHRPYGGPGDIFCGTEWCGKYTDCAAARTELKADKDVGDLSGCPIGFVTYKAKACEKTNFWGTEQYLRECQEEGLAESTVGTIMVSSLPYDVRSSLLEEDLHAMFVEYGDVTRLTLPRSPETGNPRGYAYVEMDTDANAERAIEGLNGSELLGKTIKVEAWADINYGR